MKLFSVLLHLFMHHWRRVGRLGAHVYWECDVCGARDFGDIVGLRGPVDQEWLTGRRDSLYDRRRTGR